MISRIHLRKCWALLDAQERRNAFKVLVIMCAGALMSAAMVGSVFPFLSVLSDPGLIRETPAFAYAYAAGGFETDYEFLVALGIGAITVIVLSNLVLILNTWAVTRFSQMRVHSISRRLLGHYLAQPYETFLNRHSGDMATNILSETQQVVGQFMRPLAELTSASLTVFAVVALLVSLNPGVAIATIVVFAAIYGGVMVLARRYVRRMGRVRARANAERYRIAGEALCGIKDVKLFGREAAYLDRFTAPSLDMARSEVNVDVLAHAPRYAIQIIAFGGIIVLCLVLLDPESLNEREALGGLLPILGVLAFAGQRLMPELQKLYQSITRMTAGAAALDRVHEDLHSRAGAFLPKTRPVALGLKHSLRLSHIRYTYPGAERAGLLDVTLDIRAGERIGIVGASGAGKTTLSDVVLGLLTPHRGDLHVDGVKVTPETLRPWQASVGYVPQDIFLTDASLSENIALGLRLDEIDPEKVRRAARIAQLHDFAMAELPDGYATRIGERGVRLSGGQRQRIGIARALYHDADLIVFDEATSALDNLTEREVMASIDTLPGDKTILMIAHRLSTVKVCDRIVVMERGQVADVGRWEELVARNAAFRALAEAA